MTISGPSVGTAGEDLVLICSVRVVEHLIAQTIVHVKWSGGSLGSPNGVMEHIIYNESYISNTLIFNPLLPSHGARYTCQARINILSVNLLKMSSDTRNIIVQCKLQNIYILQSLKEIIQIYLNRFTQHEHVCIQYVYMY